MTPSQRQGRASTSAPWQRSLATAVGSVGELLDLLGLPGDLLQGGLAAASDFPLRVPRGFVGRMRPGDPTDPLLLQVLPSAAELVATPGFTADPLAEREVAAAGGLLHKYRGRALLVLTGACAVHCRYCFRRHFPYGEHAGKGEQWRRAVDRLAADPSIEEVILSGGDPLAVADRHLAPLVERLAQIPHLRRLRVHTRLPVVLPERVDDELLTWLGGTRLATVVVLHANHAQELDDDVATAVALLRQAGSTVLNQAVLLAGVNDSAATLAQLSRRLFDVGALPYYLHLLDRVAGAAHFDVPEDTARRLVRELRAELPGYLVPRLVREVPGAPSKLPVE
jgi:EF-P beta-lysylation protein EpmB